MSDGYLPGWARIDRTIPKSGCLEQMGLAVEGGIMINIV